MSKVVMRIMPTVNERVSIRPSSTVVVVREASVGPELFMVRRHEGSSFGAAYAFPGGVIDVVDSRVHESCGALGSAEANARLGIEDGGLDYYSAAVRELFEETGVLLADVSSLDEELASVRDALNEGTEDWAEFVARNELQLFCEQLHYFSHWVTPPQRAKRYSTRFFLAVLPQGQNAVHCGGELTDSQWATASDMLAAGRRNEVTLHFPTVKTLESIARHKTLEGLVDWARACVEWGITTMVPLLIERDGKQDIVLPGDRDYPGSNS